MNLEKALDSLLPSERSEPSRLQRAIRYSVFSGGKRIRPIILMEAFRACGGKGDGAIGLACAVEFIHTSSLIHDDLPAMDNDDYRRGKPSCHKAFGEATAILAGNSLLILAFEAIAKNYTPDIAGKSVIALAGACGPLGMMGGQEMDLARGTKRDLRKIDLFKTAKLFEASALLGAIAARAGSKKTSALAEYGRNLGLAFQIADDIADSESYDEGSGRKKALKEADRMFKKAKTALKVLGKKADGLLEIADRIYGKIAR
jgi:geranylgeranyl diphosphate synthase type II